MGSNSKGKDLEGTSGVNMIVDNYEYEQEMRFLPANLNPDALSDQWAQFPPHGPRAYEPPSPFLTQQVPAVAMQRPGVVAQPQQHALVQNGYVESRVYEKKKSVTIKWNYAGMNVAIVGSWDNWKTTEPLHRVGQSFAIVKELPIGIYHYHFIVDGYFTHAPEFPSATHDSGFAYNILDLQEYYIRRTSETEDSPSPPSSYDNKFMDEDEFKVPPPVLPPQLPVTVSDEPSSITHLELNHLYTYKHVEDQAVELQSTNLFQDKYVIAKRRER